MVHAKGLSDKTIEGILLNNDSEEDFDSGNINKSSGSESQYEILTQRWKILPVASDNAETMWKEQKVENGIGTPHVHLMTSLFRNLFLEWCETMFIGGGEASEFFQHVQGDWLLVTFSGYDASTTAQNDFSPN